MLKFAATAIIIIFAKGGLPFRRWFNDSLELALNKFDHLSGQNFGHKHIGIIHAANAVALAAKAINFQDGHVIPIQLDR